MKKIEKLRAQYPTYVSLDQFRVICRIAKRTVGYPVASRPRDIIPKVYF